jgi:hypothetical protein
MVERDFWMLRFLQWGSALAVCVVVLAPASGRAAAAVERQLDCRSDKVCLDGYKPKKEEWLACLERAGLSEKKRKKLDSKMEAIGLRNLRKEEAFIFDSKRKDCHKNFSEALHHLGAKKSKDLSDKPPPLDLLEEKSKD